jgi:hypothetical protein
MVNTFSFPEAVDLITRQFTSALDSLDNSVVERVYTVENMPMNNGNSVRKQEFDSEEYAKRKNEGDSAEKARFTMGYYKDLEIKSLALHVEITKEMRVMNKYQSIAQTINDVSRYCANRIDLDGANRFTFGNATSYTNMDGETVSITGGDGLAIFSASHTLTASSTTYSNIVTGNPEFDAAGEALRLALSVGQANAYNNFGQNMGIDFDTILTSDDWEVVENVSILLRSTSWINNDPSSNTSGQNSGVINFYAGHLNHIIWPRLGMDANGSRNSTYAKRWFVYDSSKLQAYLIYLERPHMVMPPFGGAEGNFDYSTYDWEFGQTSMHSLGIISARGIAGSFPS